MTEEAAKGNSINRVYNLKLGNNAFCRYHGLPKKKKKAKDRPRLSFLGFSVTGSSKYSMYSKMLTLLVVTFNKVMTVRHYF